MRSLALVRAAATVLSLAFFSHGAVLAQAQPRTLTDTAPLPAGERESVGAVILMNEPVLAQRQAMQQAQERSGVDTRSMGAGPARVLQRVLTRQELKQKRAIDAGSRHQAPPQ
ncbi:MAG: hypothetical protein JWP65_182 [Ramlibacter sp.]|jgi:acetyl-CoA acetyltransferase|uniref:hypothetical protein n=1 Tax=Ramlibacter sp. TaxID=1917967 RepID=UPI0026085809|nr:hypothetical protein [Ramlibacter sp.]MDB5749761.1 hypothetical protein [Ramlibacter sp.]